MIAAIPKVMETHCLDLRQRNESPRKVESNCQSLAEIFAKMSQEEKQALTAVYTQGSMFSGREIAILAGNCPNISILRFENAYRIGDTELKLIAQCFKDTLEELNVKFASNSADQTEFMGGLCRLLPDLRDQVEWISDNGVEELLLNCPKLKKLDLSGAKITEKSLETISKCLSLTHINLHSCSFGQTNEANKQAVKKLHRMRPDLTIGHNKGTYHCVVNPKSTVKKWSLLKSIKKGCANRFNNLLQMMTKIVLRIFDSFHHKLQ